MTNPPKVEATFKSEIRSTISLNTIRQCIEHLEDVGLRNARLGFRRVEETHLMENIIYNELRSRGYTVEVGVVEKRIQEKASLVNTNGSFKKIIVVKDVVNATRLIGFIHTMQKEAKLESVIEWNRIKGPFYKMKNPNVSYF